MFKTVFAIAAVAASALLWAGSSSSAPSPPNVTCSPVTQSFTGTAHDLTVPADNYCDIENATITHNLIVQHDSGADLTNTTVGNDARYADDSGGEISGSTIGHDATVGFNGGLGLQASQIGHNLVAHQPNGLGTGCGDPTAECHVQVGNDFVIDGSPGPPDPTNFIFNGLCDLSVGRDLRITNRWVTLGIGIGLNTCGGTPSGPVSVGRDLVFSGNSGLAGFFGPSGFDIDGVTVGRDLTVTRNSATGDIALGDNTVGRNATCRDNSPAAVSFTGPNSVGGKNNGCP